MSNFDDDEALFDDIYDEEEAKIETAKNEAADPSLESKSTVDPTASSVPVTSTTTTNDHNFNGLQPPDPQQFANLMNNNNGFPTDPNAQAQLLSALAAFQQQQQQQPQAPPPPALDQYPDNNNNGNNGAPQHKDAGKMFVGGLNWETSEEGLKEYFSQYGEVADLNIMRDNNTGRSRGFGFLTFADPSSVDKVVNKTHILDGKVIDPKRAIGKDEQERSGKLFVGGIAPEVTPEEFKEYFARYGKIVDSQLMIDKDTGKSRGYGFITYETMEAVDVVTQNKYVMFHGRQMEIKKAEPRAIHNRNVAAQQAQQVHAQLPTMNPYMAASGAPGSTGEMSGMNQQAGMAQYWQQMQQMQYWMQMQQQMQLQQQTGGLPQIPQQQQQQQVGAGAGGPTSGSNSIPVNTNGRSYGQQQDDNQSGNGYDNYDDEDEDELNDEDSVPNPQEQKIRLPSGPKHMKERHTFRGGRGGFRSGGRGGFRGRGGGFRGGRGGRGRGGFHPYKK